MITNCKKIILNNTLHLKRYRVKMILWTIRWTCSAGKKVWTNCSRMSRVLGLS